MCFSFAKDIPIRHMGSKMETTANSAYSVLVADDDVTFNHMMRDALSDAGFNVLISSSGLKALNMIQFGGKVDVVLLDYRMPTLDGSQTLEHLKNQFPNVKTIGVTGIDTSQLPDTYRNEVAKLLPKPVKISDLVEAIHSVLGVPAAAETEKEPAKRRTDWRRFIPRAVLVVVCCYLTLVMLYHAVGKVLSQ